MWNRVVLLTCGMAFGWNLANYWAAPRSDLARYRYRLAASAIMGLILAAVLAWENLDAGIVALTILLGSGLVAYAGSARQLGKPVERNYKQPDPPLHRSQVPAVILIVDAEPDRYQGPLVWGGRMRAEQALGRPTPHWFIRPYICYRIKQAYEKMPDGPPSYRALSELTERLQERLGGRAVIRQALVWGTPPLADALHGLAALGHGRMLILPVDLEPERVLDLCQAIVQSRLREGGIDACMLPDYSAGRWYAEAVSTRFDELLHGGPLDGPLELETTHIDAIYSMIDERLEQTHILDPT